MNKLLIVLGVLILLGVSMGVYSNLQKPFNCEEIHPVYLKPSEISSASKLIDEDPTRIVVFPETQQLNADNQVLECENFHYDDYIQGLE